MSRCCCSSPTVELYQLQNTEYRKNLPKKLDEKAINQGYSCHDKLFFVALQLGDLKSKTILLCFTVTHSHVDVDRCKRKRGNMPTGASHLNKLSEVQPNQQMQQLILLKRYLSGSLFFCFGGWGLKNLNALFVKHHKHGKVLTEHETSLCDMHLPRNQVFKLHKEPCNRFV